MQRRRFLHQTALGAAAWPLASLPAAADDTLPKPAFAAPRALAPMRASVDRIIDISVCTRPFRAQGPRIEAQRLGAHTVIHNYGHGGSGWSLSWGSARQAVALALATRQRRIVVVGCGAIGLTSARVAQRAGLRVRILCDQRPPDVRSSAATGVWSPSSRICTQDLATPDFTQRWELMARDSFRMLQSLLGLPGQPIEWHDGYVLSDGSAGLREEHASGEPHYAELSGLLRDLRPRSQLLQPHEHPFPVPQVRRYTQMVFNLPSYTKLLMDDFEREGGSIEQRHFDSPRQFAALPERTIINATGYGARALLGDESIVPVRGQTARLIPQPEVDYGLNWRGHNLSVVPRRDGLLVQAQAEGDYGNADDRPDRAASEAAVQRLASLFKR
jgi:glycine/D-amino acid oxidase-like deaminating enzyme